MKLFDRTARDHMTHQIATATNTSYDRAALVLQEALDYGPASEHFEVVLPILWKHVKEVARQVVDHAKTVEDTVASSFVASVEDTEAADRMFTEHPDLNGDYA